MPLSACAHAPTHTRMRPNGSESLGRQRCGLSYHHITTMGCRCSKQKRAPGPGRVITGSSLLRKACMHAVTHGSLEPRIVHAADSAPTVCEPRRAKSRCRNTALGGRYPTPAYFLGCFRNLEHSAPHVIATPPPRVPRLTSDISCRGTHLHSWSHRYCRSLCDHNMGSFGQI